MANRRSESLVPEWAIPTVALIALALFLLPGFRPLAVAAGVIAVIALSFFIFNSIRRTWRAARTRSTSLHGHPAARFNQRQHSNEPARWTRQRLFELCESGNEFQFQKLISAIFQRDGYRVQLSGDSELLIENSDETAVVHFQHWSASAISGNQVREFAASLQDANVARGILVSLRGCTKEAQTLAAKYGIAMLNEAAVVDKICGPKGAISREILSILQRSDAALALH